MQIGIDLGGTHIAVGVVSERNTIIAKREMDIAKPDLIEDMRLYIIDHVKILIGEVLRDIGAPSCVMTKIGIAIPGRVKDNVAYDIFNLGIDEFDIADILSKHYGIEVVIRNDAKCAALAEKKMGSLIDYDDCVFLCCGTGIGGATFIDGKMLEYHKEWGSEYGHMIIEKDGRECKCGNRGCWEKYASMRAFKDSVIELLHLHKDIESETIHRILLERVNSGDEKIIKLIDDFLEYLLIGISNIANILQPTVICIGGSFVYYENIFYSKLLEKLDMCNINGYKPRIVLAEHENDGGMIGAIL